MDSLSGRVRVRGATPDDAATIVELVRALAVFDGEPATRVRLSEIDVCRDAFGTAPRFEVLLAELDGATAGLALFFPTYSTWEGRPGLWVEDLFVVEEARARGVGRALLAAVAQVARARGAARIDLVTLDWNPARRFYARLGMTEVADWVPCRLEGEALVALAAEAAELAGT